MSLAAASSRDLTGIVVGVPLSQEAYGRGQGQVGCRDSPLGAPGRHAPQSHLRVPQRDLKQA